MNTENKLNRVFGYSPKINSMTLSNVTKLGKIARFSMKIINAHKTTHKSSYARFSIHTPVKALNNTFVLIRNRFITYRIIDKV